MNVLHVPAQGPAAVVDVPDEDHAQLAELQRLVGGYVEAIALPDGRGIMLLNEDGRMLRLASNEVASILADAPSRLGVPTLLGDVVVLSSTGEEFGPVDDETVAFVRTLVDVKGA